MPLPIEEGDIPFLPNIENASVDDDGVWSRSYEDVSDVSVVKISDFDALKKVSIQYSLSPHHHIPQ